MSEEYVFAPEELEILWPLEPGDYVRTRPEAGEHYAGKHGIVQEAHDDDMIVIAIAGMENARQFKRGELDLILKRRRVNGTCKAAAKENTGLEWMKGDRVRVARDSGHEHAGALGTIERIDQFGAFWIELDDKGGLVTGDRSLLEFVCRPDVKALPLPTREGLEAMP